jgi:hypothetical protein
MEITGLGWCGTRTGRCSELAHFYENVLGLRLAHPGMEHFAAGPVVGFAVRFRRPLRGDPGNEKPSTRWVHGRPAARHRLPERVSGFKWNLRGTGNRHAAAIFQFFTSDVISAQSASFTGK